MKLKIIFTTPINHDKQMARSQALVHFIGRGLNDLKLKEQVIATPDYQALLKMNSMVENDTWGLFFDMQKYNPFIKHTRKQLLQSLSKLENKIFKYEARNK